jgi:hypothetical protein
MNPADRQALLFDLCMALRKVRGVEGWEGRPNVLLSVNLLLLGVRFATSGARLRR